MTISSTICIPRVDFNVPKTYIEERIRDMKIGSIEKLNEIPLHKDPNYKRIIIKMKWNNNNSKTKQMLSHMKETGNVKLVYDMPWYWKICPAR